MVEVDGAAELLGAAARRPAPRRRRRPARSRPRAPGSRARAATAPWSRSAGGRSRPRRARRSSPTPRRRPSAGARPRSIRPARESTKIARVPPKSRQKLQRAAGAGLRDPFGPLAHRRRRRRRRRGPSRRPRLRRAPAARGCPGAGRSSSWSTQPVSRRCHQARSRISSTQEREMFQSSDMSWSSQSIETETVENSQRTSGSRPALLVEPGVLLEVGHLLARFGADAAAFADLLAGPRRALVDVDLVAEQEELLGPLLALVRAIISWARTWRASISWPSSLRSFDVGVGALVRQRHPAGAEADVERAVAEGADHARRQLGAGLGPALLAVELDRVRGGRAGLEALEPDQRVVVARRPRRSGRSPRGRAPRRARRSRPRSSPRCRRRSGAAVRAEGQASRTDATRPGGFLTPGRGDTALRRYLAGRSPAAVLRRLPDRPGPRGSRFSA